MGEELTIVVGVDFSTSAGEAVETAVRMAHAPGSRLHVAHVVPASHGKTRRHFDEAEHELEALPRKVLRFAADHGGHVAEGPRAAPRNVWAHVLLGDPTDSLLQLAVDVDADLVVIGPNSQRGERARLGRVARALLESAHCPVVVGRTKSYDGLEHSAGIDPPCSDCLRTRSHSGGEQLWCELHAREREPIHIVEAS